MGLKTKKQKLRKIDKRIRKVVIEKTEKHNQLKPDKKGKDKKQTQKNFEILD